ncbi:MAG TPA: type IVB secretion system protein IcmH/DotU [Caulobacteraceae bacterium]|jgi:type VI secretion system protein ImpK
MTSDSGSGPNRTVFRPSPLQGLKSGDPAAPAAPAAPPGYPQPAYAPPGYAQPQQQHAYAPAAAAAQAARPAARLPDDDIPQPPKPAEWRNPMMSQAASYLALIAGVRAGRARISLPDLHGKASAAIAAFDQAMQGRYPTEQLQRAKYALCATADDVALNLPDQQADAAEWARRSMVVRFFGENIGGDRFWRLLDDMVARPAEFRDLLELFHACMAAGFEGRYRVMPDGKRAHQEMMQRVYTALEHPKTLSMTELSPRWKGHPTARSKVGFWTPLVMAGGAALVTLLVVYLVLRFILAQTGAPAMASLDGVTPAQPLRLSRSAEPPPAAPAGEQLMRLRQFLAPEIQQGLVVVIEDPSTVRVRTTVGQLFKSGSDQLDPDRVPLFNRIAAALETEPGPIRVEGYTDSDRVSGLTFPDNTALSQARADRVAELIRPHLSNPGRVTAQGYGDAQAIADNSTAAGKSKNRRVEVVIQRGG